MLTSLAPLKTRLLLPASPALKTSVVTGAVIEGAVDAARHRARIHRQHVLYVVDRQGRGASDVERVAVGVDDAVFEVELVDVAAIEHVRHRVDVDGLNELTTVVEVDSTEVGRAGRSTKVVLELQGQNVVDVDRGVVDEDVQLLTATRLTFVQDLNNRVRTQAADGVRTGRTSIKDYLAEVVVRSRKSIRLMSWSRILSDLKRFEVLYRTKDHSLLGESVVHGQGVEPVTTIQDRASGDLLGDQDLETVIARPRG